MLKSLQKILWSVLISGTIVSLCHGETPIFLIMPNTKVTASLVQSQTGTAIYQVLNNSSRNIDAIQLSNLPAGVSLVTNPGYDYCSNLSTLTTAQGATPCLIELQINSNVIGNISGGPVFSGDP